MASSLTEIEANKRKYTPFLQAAEIEFNLPEGALVQLASHESAFSSDVIEGRRLSSTGARGLMQFMPPAAQEWSQKLGIAFEQRYAPEHQARMGGAYLASMYHTYRKDPNPNISRNALRWAYAAYDTGPYSKLLRKAMDLSRQGLDYAHVLPDETRKYIADMAHRFGWGQYSDSTQPTGKITQKVAPKDKEATSATQEIFENFAVLQGNLGALVGLPNSKKKFMAKFLLAVGKEHKIIRPGDEFSINSAR